MGVVEFLTISGTRRTSKQRYFHLITIPQGRNITLGGYIGGGREESTGT